MIYWNEAREAMAATLRSRAGATKGCNMLGFCLSDAVQNNSVLMLRHT